MNKIEFLENGLALIKKERKEKIIKILTFKGSKEDLKQLKKINMDYKFCKCSLKLHKFYFNNGYVIDIEG